MCLLSIYDDFTNALPTIRKILSFWGAIQMPLTAPAIAVSKVCHFVPVPTPRCLPRPRLSPTHLLRPFCIFFSLSRHTAPIPTSLDCFVLLSPIPEACFNFLLFLYVKGKRVQPGYPQHCQITSQERAGIQTTVSPGKQRLKSEYTWRNYTSTTVLNHWRLLTITAKKPNNVSKTIMLRKQRA